MHTDIDVQLLKANIRTIKKGLIQLGRDRPVSLPTHTAWDLVDDLQQRCAEMMAELERIEEEKKREQRGDL